MVRFSVVLPAYKDLGHVVDNIKRLAREDVEFIVAADLLSEEDRKTLEALAERYPLKLDLSDERRGKVAALNSAIERAEGDIIVFVDSDARVVHPDLLGAIEKALERGDFGSGIILLRGESFFEKMARIDYISINASMYIGAKYGFSIGLNGAFIYAKRRVVDELGGFAREIIEDVDFALRASLKGFKPVFIEEACVETGAPSTLRGWYKQRKRWVIGGAVLLKKYWRRVLPHIKAAAPQVFAVNPVMVLLTPILLLPSHIFYTLLLILASVLASIFPPLLFLLYMSIAYGFAKQIFLVLAAFAIVFFWYWYWGRRFRFKGFKKRHIIPYFFVYGPVWSALTAVWVIITLAKGGNVTLKDWKV